eukprot:jgi/Psemu1/10101/gm1.10101_g
MRLETVKNEGGEASLVYTTADGEPHDFSGLRQGDWCWLLPSESNNDSADTCVSSSRVRSVCLPMQSRGRGPKQEPVEEQARAVTNWCWLPSGSEDGISNPVGSSSQPLLVGSSATDAEIKDELDPVPSLKTENEQSIRRGTKRVLGQTETNYEIDHGDEMIKESESSNLEMESPLLDDTYSSDDDFRRDDSEEDTAQMTRSIHSQEPERGRWKAKWYANSNSSSTTNTTTGPLAFPEAILFFGGGSKGSATLIR